MKSKIAKWIWIGITAVVSIYTIIFIARNIYTIITTNMRISELTEQTEFYRNRIKEDSTLLEQLKYDEHLERFAREKFHMQRANEYIYLIED